MGSTAASSSMKCPIYVGYRCSACGKVHHYKYQIKTHGSATQYGYANKSQRADLKSTASSMAYADMMVKLMNLQSALNEHDYKNANIPENRCNRCGSREPWMIPSYSILKRIAVISLICGLAFFLISYLLAQSEKISAFVKVSFIASSVLTYGAIGLFILYAILKILGKKKTGKSGAELTDSELPLVGIDLNQYKSLALERFGTDEAAMEELIQLL